MGSSRDEVLFDVRLVVTHDAVDHFLSVSLLSRVTVAPKMTRPFVGNLGDIDHLGIGELAFDFLNATFTETLLLAGGMVFGIFFRSPCSRASAIASIIWDAARS